MRAATILLVEGRGAGANSLASAFDKAGLTVTIVHNGTAAMEWIGQHEPALIVLDASTMRSSGVRTCKRLRRALNDTPIVHCMGEDQPEDRSAGADVTLVKPFTARKVLNRIWTLLPANDLDEEIVRLGGLTLFCGKRSVDVKGQGEKKLTPKLAGLLEQFLRHPNQILSRNWLMEKVWKTSYFGDTRTLDVHIRWLREIIESDPANPEMLRTVRGVGYILSVLPQEVEAD